MQNIIDSIERTHQIYRIFKVNHNLEYLTFSLSSIHQDDVCFLIASLYNKGILTEKEKDMLVGGDVDDLEDENIGDIMTSIPREELEYIHFLERRIYYMVLSFTALGCATVFSFVVLGLGCSK